MKLALMSLLITLAGCSTITKYETIKIPAKYLTECKIGDVDLVSDVNREFVKISDKGIDYKLAESYEYLVGVINLYRAKLSEDPVKIEIPSIVKEIEDDAIKAKLASIVLTGYLMTERAEIGRCNDQVNYIKQYQEGVK